MNKVNVHNGYELIELRDGDAAMVFRMEGKSKDGTPIIEPEIYVSQDKRSGCTLALLTAYFGAQLPEATVKACELFGANPNKVKTITSKEELDKISGGDGPSSSDNKPNHGHRRTP
jgi:hypothetical protein